MLIQISPWVSTCFNSTIGWIERFCFISILNDLCKLADWRTRQNCQPKLLEGAVLSADKWICRHPHVEQFPFTTISDYLPHPFIPYCWLRLIPNYCPYIHGILSYHETRYQLEQSHHHQPASVETSTKTTEPLVEKTIEPWQYFLMDIQFGVTANYPNFMVM